MGTSGWVTDPNPADSVLLTGIAGAFAQSFDQAWNNPAGLNTLELASIAAVVSMDFARRGPGPLTNPQFQNPANWQQGAAACAAIVLASDIYFVSQGIIPPTPG